MYSIHARCLAQRQRLGVLRGSLSAVRFHNSSAAPTSAHAAPGFQPPRNVAVVGGGLTGLTTAFWLSRFLRDAKITLYEAGDRLGGWIDTEEVEVTTPQGKRGTVSFERGARMVQLPTWNAQKCDHLFFWELVAELGLMDEVLAIPRKDALKAYIYYPDHLVGMPDRNSMSLSKLLPLILREPIFKGAIPAFVHGMIYSKIHSRPRFALGYPEDLYKVPAIQQRVDEISLGEHYVQAMGNRNIVDNLLSAMIHGIWGGDVWKLSETRDPAGNALTRPKYRAKLWDIVSVEDTDAALMVSRDVTENDVYRTMSSDHSNIWFKGGFSTLTNTLVAELEKSPNVTIETGTPIESIRANETRALEIRTKGSDKAALYDKAVSTIFSKTLASLADNKLPSLKDTHAVTIMAVNLWYPTPGLNDPYRGAGYLIPQSVRSEHNPELALGVLFDSDREVSSLFNGEDSLQPWRDATSEPEGTKFTVLLGGHYWDGIPPDQLPSKDEAIGMAKSVVARHLGIPQHENDRVVASAKLCRDCIPQHHVGHWARMRQAKDELLEAFGGNLAVAGPSYQMPGVFGSIRAGRDVAAHMAGQYPGLNKFLAPVGDTGLDRFSPLRSHHFVSKEDVPWRYSSAANKGYVETLLKRGQENL